MKKLFRYIIILFFLLQVLGCDTDQEKGKDNKLNNKTENVFGLYSYYVTGYNSHCETVKHLLRLNQDSTFIFKIYCYADSLSPFKPTIKKGKWAKNTDSFFHFICSDTTTFNVALLYNGQLEIIAAKGQNRFNYSYTKDTTKDEMFWRKKDK